MPSIVSLDTGRFILLCWLVFLIFWGVAATSAKPTQERSAWSRQRLVLSLAIAIGVLLFLSGHLSWVTQFVLWPYSTSVGILADVVVVVGLGIMLWSRVILGGNWSGQVVLKQNHELITHGPYAYVRHPIYSGLLLMFLGEAIWFGTLGWLLLVLCVLIGIGLKARAEEQLLTQHFPEYPAYRAKTKALIPFIL